MKLFDVTNSIPATNYSLSRQYAPEGICYHITGDSTRNQAVNHFRKATSIVSAHYVIEKNGDVFLCVHPEHKAYHCGEVRKAIAQIYHDKGQLNPNNYLIGIECVSNGEALTTEQWESLTKLTLDLINTYKIKVDRYHLIGHNELDTVERVTDPISSYKVDDVVSAVELLKMQGVKQLTVEEAMMILVEKGIVSNADYWMGLIKYIKFFDILIINVAKALTK